MPSGSPVSPNYDFLKDDGAGSVQQGRDESTTGPPLGMRVDGNGIATLEAGSTIGLRHLTGGVFERLAGLAQAVPS